MKPAAVVILSCLGLGIILTLPKTDASDPHPTPANVSANIFPTPNYPRLIKMQELLRSGAYKQYNSLCLQATTQPQIGMTIDQSRNTSWCFPYERNKTINIYGERVQEIYLKRNYIGESDSRYSPRQYLYFENGILTTIQE